MKDIKTISGKLQIVEKLKNSLNGNPRYMALIGDLVVKTKPDAQLGYSITNYRDKQVIALVKQYKNHIALLSVREQA